MMEIEAKIIENRSLGDGYFKLVLSAEPIAKQAIPGQFVMLAVSGQIDPLLKRPFGIMNVDGDNVELLYEVVGRGTKQIAETPAGTLLRLLGPLGNGFPQYEGKRIAIIAGGRGVAPMYWVAKSLQYNNELYFIYGARSKQQVKLMDELEALDLKELIFMTDDGGFGLRGRVADNLKSRMKDWGAQVSLSCGPDAMLAALAQELSGQEGEHLGSFEALMGCGIGICHSCALLMTNGHYLKVCSDGPIFPLEDVAWND